MSQKTGKELKITEMITSAIDTSICVDSHSFDSTKPYRWRHDVWTTIKARLKPFRLFAFECPLCPGYSNLTFQPLKTYFAFIKSDMQLLQARGGGMIECMCPVCPLNKAVPIYLVCSKSKQWCSANAELKNCFTEGLWDQIHYLMQGKFEIQFGPKNSLI